MKYLIAQKTGLLFPIIFPDMLTHSSIAAGLKEEHIRSAGFFSITGGRAFLVSTHDHSASLNLQPHPDDATLIRDWLKYGDAFSLGSQMLAASVAEPIDPNEHVFTPTVFTPISAPSAVLGSPSV